MIKGLTEEEEFDNFKTKVILELSFKLLKSEKFNLKMSGIN